MRKGPTRAYRSSRRPNCLPKSKRFVKAIRRYRAAVVVRTIALAAALITLGFAHREPASEQITRRDSQIANMTSQHYLTETELKSWLRTIPGPRLDRFGLRLGQWSTNGLPI